MNFIKLDPQDQPLQADAPEWASVLDARTNLIWDKEHQPKRLTHAQAEQLVAGRSDGRRLPTLQELESIRDITRCNPAIDTEVFPGTPSAWFRTSSPFVGASGSSWFVHFSGGDSFGFRHGLDAFVRLVRSAPAVPGQ